MIEAKYMTEDELKAHEMLHKLAVKSLMNLTKQHIKLGDLLLDDSRVIEIRSLYLQMFQLAGAAKKRAESNHELSDMDDLEADEIKPKRKYTLHHYRVIDEVKGVVFTGNTEAVAAYLGSTSTRKVHDIRRSAKKTGRRFNSEGIAVEMIKNK